MQGERPTQRGSHQQAAGQILATGLTIEPVGKCAQIPSGIFAEVKLFIWLCPVQFLNAMIEYLTKEV